MINFALKYDLFGLAREAFIDKAEELEINLKAKE